MRFTGQNKRAINPKYFLNEEKSSEELSAQGSAEADQFYTNVAMVIDYLEKNKYNGLALTPKEQQIVKQKMEELQVLDPSGVLDLTATAEKIGAYLEKRMAAGGFSPKSGAVTPTEQQPQKYKIARRGSGFKECKSAQIVQSIAKQIVSQSNIPQKNIILSRLSDQKVGPTTTSIINIVAPKIGVKPFPLNQQSYDDICSRDESFFNFVAQELRNLQPEVIARAITSTKTAVTESNLAKSKKRDASYNLLKEEKNKKLFEALIKG